MNNFTALCAIGAEPVLTNELKLLGFLPYSRLPGRVFFSSEEELFTAMFRANYFLRTADRIFLLLEQKEIKDFDSLFETVHGIDWQDFFCKDVKITVDKVRCSGSKLSSEHAIQAMVHKAICCKLCSKWKMNSLPETGSVFFVRVYIEKNVLYLCLDLSGEPLHRRGYRLSGGAAPMRETMAAALLQLMQWKRKYPLHDAFCGSGTIPIEAAWYAYNIPPGINRSFAFENFACFGAEKTGNILTELKNRAAQEIRTDCLARITGSDISAEAVSLARANAERACIVAGRALTQAGITRHIPRPEFTQADFTGLQAPYSSGMLLSNPPYGERLGDEESALKLYGLIAKLPASFPGWKMGFITDKERFETIFTAENKPDSLKKHKLKGGNIDTCLYIFSPQ